MTKFQICCDAGCQIMPCDNDRVTSLLSVHPPTSVPALYRTSLKRKSRRRNPKIHFASTVRDHRLSCTELRLAFPTVTLCVDRDVERLSDVGSCERSVMTNTYDTDTGCRNRGEIVCSPVETTGAILKDVEVFLLSYGRRLRPAVVGGGN